jgi:hypothetical protein
LLSIATILGSLKPKSLIDQENLNEALRKIQDMMTLLANMGKGTTSGATSSSGGGPFTGQPKIELLTGKESLDAIIEVTDAVAVLADVMAQIQEEENYKSYLSLIEFQKKLGDLGGYSADMNRGAGYGYNANAVTVEIIDKTSGLIEVVQTAVQENNRFGNNLSYAGAI